MAAAVEARGGVAGQTRRRSAAKAATPNPSNATLAGSGTDTARMEVAEKPGATRMLPESMDSQNSTVSRRKAGPAEGANLLDTSLPSTLDDAVIDAAPDVFAASAAFARGNATLQAQASATAARNDKSRNGIFLGLMA